MMGICRFCRQGAMVKDAVGPICPDCIEDGYAESTDQIDTIPKAVIQHLDISHNHEAGLIPMSTQTMMRALSARIEELEAAIRRQAAASKTLRQSTLSEVQHIKDSERKEYVATKTLDSERDANAILTEENEALSARIAELEAERSATLGQMKGASQ